MNVIERWAAEAATRVPAGPTGSELRRRVSVRRVRRAGTLAVLAVALTFVVVAGLLRSPSEHRVRVIAPSPTVSTSPTTSTTSPRPGKSSLTTRWRPMGGSEGIWPDALAAIRSSDTADSAVARALPILRAGRERPSETITARVIDQGSDEAVIWFEWRGLADDSIAGMDARIRVDTGMSTVVIRTAERRAVCRRGVAGDACL